MDNVVRWSVGALVVVHGPVNLLTGKNTTPVNWKSVDLQRKQGEMRKLHEKRPIWHAVAWIGIYVVAVNIGDGLSDMIGEPNSGTTALLAVLSIWLILYLRRDGWLEYYGVRPVHRADFNTTWLYIPLVLIAVMQYAKGLRDDVDLTAVLLILALMVCVGFLEELIFRGMLFRGIQRTSNLTRAVVISGVTFGIGHIVNLARGMTGLEQVMQIGFGVVMGIVLALLFAVTGTIVPLIVFHTLFNISGTLTASNPGSELLMLAATTVLCAGYAAYLVSVLRRGGADPGISVPPRLQPAQPLP